MRERIIELLESKENLPPLPDVLVRLRMLLKDPDTSVADIAGTIELEPVLTGKILKISNSTFYSRGAKQITSLPLAITKLGFKMIYRIAYSLKIITLFQKKKILDSRMFWRHSLAVAVFTQSLGKRVRIRSVDQDITYLAGLMHDVGILVFMHLIPKEYTAFAKAAASEEKPLEEQERARFGIEHSELGASFIERWWGMEERISNAVLYHHGPFHGGDEDRRIAQLLNISNGVCNSQGITNGLPSYHEIFNDSTWDDIGLSLADSENILTDMRAALDEAEEFVGGAG